MAESFDGFGLAEDNTAFGAMVCDIATFRSIYRLHLRSMERRPENAVLVMIRARRQNESGISEEDRSDAMNRIGAALASKLRRHDVLTGFDTSFFLIMLFNIDAEDAEKVMRRLIEKINEEAGGDADIETKLQAVAPVGGDRVFEV
ncbi:hypothetical protein AGMMS49983_02510 [Clostridia bacterium]|nr:hypothetical protein AGMMS49983_02510 [Clostridia bacterium]